MPTDGLITIYATGDPSLAAWLVDLLAEQGIPAHRWQGGVSGIPAASMGIVETQVMVLRSEAEAHREEIQAALAEVEADSSPE